jgi:energy-converting hydrogenase Eha subunit A
MKRKITLSIALVLSIILVSLTISDSTVRAEPPQRYTWDTGVISPGPNQTLRVTVTGALDLNDLYVIQVNKQSYTQGVCSGGICRLAVASQNSSNPIALSAGEAASIDITPPPNSSAVRAAVVSNSRNLRVAATMIDTVTGEVTTHIIIANTEGDIH